MRAIAAADMLRRLPGEIATTFDPFALCQRALCAVAIRALPAAEILLPLLPAPFRAVIALLSLSS
jgi:hypothetical protein